MNAPGSPHEIPASWRLTDALLAYPALSIIPGGVADVVLAGEIAFAATGPRKVLIEDVYSLTIEIPRDFPARGLPRVLETGGRIPKDYHQLEDGSLCLGSSTRLRLLACQDPTVGGFIERAVVPYLYGRSYFERFGQMPFGELAHGRRGVEQDLRALFLMPPAAGVDAILEVAALRRRTANKRPCPCSSGRRLGRCHHVTVNRMRAILGRSWFEGQALHLFGRHATRSRQRWFGRRKLGRT